MMINTGIRNIDGIAAKLQFKKLSWKLFVVNDHI